MNCVISNGLKRSSRTSVKRTTKNTCNRDRRTKHKHLYAEKGMQINALSKLSIIHTLQHCLVKCQRIFIIAPDFSIFRFKKYLKFTPSWLISWPFRSKMSVKQKKQRKLKQTCFADLVVDVPKVIINPKRYTQYDCLQLIGSGTYSKCYEVAKKPTAEPFACKILSNVLILDRVLMQLVQNEISIHRKLKHKHIVEFIESFEDEKHIYMIQSLCSNHSLKDLQKYRGYVTVSECRYFVNQILEGVSYIHEKGFIHRDLKLSNVLIDDNMQMKIGDFGLSISVDDPSLMSKSLCGTTNYLAPEVVERKGFVCRSDIWAIGVIAFVLLYGYKPFEENSLNATHRRIVRADYRLPSNVDTDLKFFMKSVFQTDPALRPSAENCLQFAFFKRYVIPLALPIETFSQAYTEEEIQKEPSSIFNVFNCSEQKFLSFTDESKVIYPEIRALAEPTRKYCIEDAKYAQVLDGIFERFDAICRFHSIENDFSFSDFSELNDIEPDYWVAKWFFDTNNGFVYQICDESIGILFHEGLNIIRTPDKFCLVLKPGNLEPQFYRFDDAARDPQLKDDIDKFCELELQLNWNTGCYTAQTPYKRSKSLYLYTWFQTDEAMVMLLSNNTLQINFSKSHKKMLICPHNETITLVNGRISHFNFKTVKFATMATHGFSVHSFQMFKYVTATIKRLAQKLKTPTN